MLYGIFLYIVLFATTFNFILFITSSIVSICLVSTIRSKMIHSSFTVLLDLAALNDSSFCCRPFAFVCKWLHQFCGADCPMRHVNLLHGFVLQKKKATFSVMNSLILVEQFSLEPKKHTQCIPEEQRSGGWLIQCNVSVPLYTLDCWIWIRKGQFSFINTDLFLCCYPACGTWNTVAAICLVRIGAEMRMWLIENQSVVQGNIMAMAYLVRTKWWKECD